MGARPGGTRGRYTAWRVADVEPVLLDGRVELDRLENFSRRAGENRQSVRRWLELAFEICRDSLEIPVEALALRRSSRICPAARLELLPDERLILIAPSLVRLCIEIKTDDRIWYRFEPGESVELFGNGHVRLLNGFHLR